MKNVAVIFVIFTSTLFHKCLCWPSGAPNSQCDSMIPKHEVSAQAGLSPYEVKVEKTYYTPGENVKVSIESSTDDIKGFLIKARKEGENSAIGMFAGLPANTKNVTCNSNNKGAVSHDTRLSVKIINLEWVPPSDLSGNISFFATVVKDKGTFWVKIESPKLDKKDMSTVQSSITVQTTLATHSQTMATKSHAMATKSPIMDTKSQVMATKSEAMATASNAEASATIAPTKSMPYSTPVVSSTLTANNACKPNDAKCDGSQLYHNIVFVFFMGLFLAFWQNAF